ncbi:MAG: hypothetical protein D6785_01695, partial [Planctomycetota bacterium]
MRWFLILFSSFGLPFFLSCETIHPISLGSIYADSALNLDRNPVIVIHGMGGAKILEKGTDKVVWGAFTRDSVSFASSKGQQDLALPVWKGKFLGIEDDTYPCCPIEQINVELAGLQFSVDIYRRIMQTLGVGKYHLVLNPNVPVYKRGCSCFSFFYDWRKDIAENAIRLGKFLEEKAQFVRNQRRWAGLPDKEVKFDIVAHSMGGLVARYLLRYGTKDVLQEKNPKITWAGSKWIGRLFLVGTPNLGSTDALRALILGEEFGFFLPNVEPTLLATFPSMYQLLPSPSLDIFRDDKGRPLSIDIYSLDFWRKNHLGVFHPDQKE